MLAIIGDEVTQVFIDAELLTKASLDTKVIALMRIIVKSSVVKFFNALPSKSRWKQQYKHSRLRHTWSMTW